jgi:gamma-glutamyl hercynylcysteine S-oxide synthase
VGVFSLLRGTSPARPEQAPEPNRPALPGSADDQVIVQGRYCLLLERDSDGGLDEKTHALAWLALERDMAFVSAPDLGGAGSRPDGAKAAPRTPPLYVDRYTTTNAQFQHFVNDEGYSQMDLWPQSIWPNLLQFVDSTGVPGPRFWRQGRPAAGLESHPVVGVNWFEARAYALWCGKRLPTSSEWEHAASCCGGPDGRAGKTRYPWGNTFSPERANTWMGGPGRTAPVDKYENGATPNGIYQLVGNVWEWVATQYEYTSPDPSLRVAFEEPMVEIRGGAFDTYFETQVTCQFRTGQPFLYRGSDTGFRCCLAADRLIDPPLPTAFA